MYSVEYTFYMSGGFSYRMDTEYCEETFKSFMELLCWLADYVTAEPDCDFKVLTGIFCGNCELDSEYLTKFVLNHAESIEKLVDANWERDYGQDY